MTMRPTSLFAFILVAALGGPALAQAPPAGTPTRVRGTVESLADHTLTIKARDGGSVAVALAPDFKVRAVIAQTLADIKPGDLVGVTSVKGPDGGQQAVEVHILPKNLPNLRIGQFPWDLSAGSLMTNGAVAQVSGPPQGGVLTVSYHGKQAEITVPPGAPIVAFAPGSPSLLQPGAAVVIFALKLPDGSLTAAAVTAEKDGVKPPM
jgi:hypothetical protein